MHYLHVIETLLKIETYTCMSENLIPVCQKTSSIFINFFRCYLKIEFKVYNCFNILIKQISFLWNHRNTTQFLSLLTFYFKFLNYD